MEVADSYNGGYVKVYWSNNEGKSWTKAKGLPKIRENINTYQILTFEKGRDLAIVDYHSIYETTDYGKNWYKIADFDEKLFQILDYSIN